MYDEWAGGASKSALERKHLGKGESHGKLFTALVKQELGIDTEQASRQRQENQRLREENEGLRTENQALWQRWQDGTSGG
jgi:hypothetical protein